MPRSGPVVFVDNRGLTLPGGLKSRRIDVPIWLEVTMAMIARTDRGLRNERLGCQVDKPTKTLIERAAHETLVLSERDRAVFFDALVNPPAPSERLQRAFADHKRRAVG